MYVGEDATDSSNLEYFARTVQCLGYWIADDKNVLNTAPFTFILQFYVRYGKAGELSYV